MPNQTDYNTNISWLGAAVQKFHNFHSNAKHLHQQIAKPKLGAIDMMLDQSEKQLKKVRHFCIFRLRNTVERLDISLITIPVGWSSSKIDTFTRYCHYLLLIAIATRIAVCVADGELNYEDYSGMLP